MNVRPVYVIDDDPAVLHSTGFLLQSMGYAFDTFADAEEFLSAIDRLEPGCVITDLRMPSMNGYELQHALLKRSVGWPVVLMTSENGSAMTRQAAAAGFAGFLRKPFSAVELLAVLETCSAAMERQRPEQPEGNVD